MNSYAFSIDGPKRNNQDRYLEPVECFNGWVAAVADGVGGKPGGEVAAAAAIEAARESAKNLTWDSEAIFQRASQLIREAEESGSAQMATTMSLVRVEGKNAYVAHVGDTRIYHVRGAGIVSRTEDQTEVAMLLRDGVLSKSQAKVYPRRNVINSFLSSGKTYNIFETKFEVNPWDCIILLTDGAYDILKKSSIVEELGSSMSLDEAGERFRELLLQTGVKDDSTVVMVRI
ncbi:PP2C family protein-serine/threonine phosphatase [Novosphingobium sp.]|uniref:PP2C family protein-serine/threonine phosphatase n=1 Tax=Novosphingobium sp. TaxID=1874826 RepID=UPI002FE1D2AE